MVQSHVSTRECSTVFIHPFLPMVILVFGVYNETSRVGLSSSSLLYRFEEAVSSISFKDESFNEPFLFCTKSAGTLTRVFLRCKSMLKFQSPNTRAADLTTPAWQMAASMVGPIAYLPTRPRHPAAVPCIRPSHKLCPRLQVSPSLPLRSSPYPWAGSAFSYIYIYIYIVYNGMLTRCSNHYTDAKSNATNRNPVCTMGVSKWPWRHYICIWPSRDSNQLLFPEAVLSTQGASRNTSRKDISTMHVRCSIIYIYIYIYIYHVLSI